MRKTILTNTPHVFATAALTTSLLLLSPICAYAQPELFGAAKLSIAAIDDDDGDALSISSHSSRVGIKGATSTKEGLEITYRFVWQIDMTDNSKSSDDFITSREQYVGFKDDWGELRVGRHDTPYKKAGKKHVEFFSDTWGDYNNIISKAADIRADDSVSYYKTIDNIKFSAMYAAGDDSTAGNNAGDIISATGELTLDNVSLAASFQEIDQSGLGLKLVAGIRSGDTKVGAIIEHLEPDGTSASFTNLLASLKQQLNESNAFRIAAGVADGGAGDDPVMVTAALDHKLNKQTTVYLLAAVGRDGGLNGSSKLVGDAAVAAVGVVAKF